MLRQRSRWITRSPNRGWWYTGAALDIDFRNALRAYWNGQERTSSDFDAYTGVTISADGAVISPTRSVTVAASKFWTGTSGTIAASFSGVSTPPASTQAIVDFWDTTANNAIRLLHSSATQFQATTRSGGVASSSFTTTSDAGVVHAMSTSAKTNEFRGALDGVAFSVDTSGSEPASLTTLTLGGPNTYLRRVVIIQAALSDAEHVALTSWLLSNG